MNFLEPLNENVLLEVKKIDFGKNVKSSYAPDRVEMWYGYGSNLQSIKDGRVEVEWKRDFPDWLEKIREKYFPEANSALLCKGSRPFSDTSIDWHRDHGTFENKVVMVNFGEAIFYVQDYDNGTIIKELKNCDVVDFNSKLLHKSSQTSNERFIITLRKTRKEFTIKKLF